MAADSKASMGLWSNTHQSIVNIKQDLLGIGTVVQNQVLPQLQKMSDLLKSSRPNANGRSGGANVVADNGAPSGSGGGGSASNRIANSGAGGNGGGRIAAGATALAGMDAISNFLPGTNTAVLQDLLTQRSAFYGQGGYTGSLQDRTGAVRSLQKSIANNGTAINAMDSTRALAQAQSSGLTGANNFNQVMQGVAQASNFVPGMGVEAVTASVGGVLNAPTTVNLARTIGINIRDSGGNMLPLPQLVDKIWNYLRQTTGAQGLNKKDMEFSLQPGYGLYNMVNGLVGGDPSTFAIIKNMLLAKAEFGGKPLASITKDQMVSAGIQSATSRNIASQTAAQTGVLVSTSAAAAGGAAGAADIGTGMNRLAASMSALASALSGSNGFLSGLKGIGGRAAGGPVGGSTPYVVGEKGPELFVPKTDGTIIPNGMFRAGGGGVSSYGASGGKKALTDDQLRSTLMAAGFKGESLNTAFQVAKLESGGRPGALNPNASTGDYSEGLFQINMIGSLGKARNAQYLKEYAAIGYKGPQSLYDPLINAKIAYDISHGGTVWSNAWTNTSKKLGITDGGTSGSSNTSAGSAISSITATTDPTASARFAAARATAFGGSAGGASTTNYNYGGITINVTGATDPKTTGQVVADTVKKIGTK